MSGTLAEWLHSLILAPMRSERLFPKWLLLRLGSVQHEQAFIDGGKKKKRCSSSSWICLFFQERANTERDLSTNALMLSHISQTRCRPPQKLRLIVCTNRNFFFFFFFQNRVSNPFSGQWGVTRTCWGLISVTKCIISKIQNLWPSETIKHIWAAQKLYSGSHRLCSQWRKISK